MRVINKTFNYLRTQARKRARAHARTHTHTNVLFYIAFQMTRVVIYHK